MAKLSVFAKRLREAREIKGLSQRKLGIQANIHEDSSSPRINQYEHGIHTPDFSMAERLAKVLEIPASYLYTSDDLMAEILLLVDGLTEREKRKLVETLREGVKK